MDMAKKGAKGLSKAAQAAAAGVKHGVHKAKMASKRLQGQADNLLQTPDWAAVRQSAPPARASVYLTWAALHALQKSGFKRCNCDYGVPEGDPDYVPCPRERYEGPWTSR